MQSDTRRTTTRRTLSLRIILCVGVLLGAMVAQTKPPVNPTTPIEHAISLAANARCDEAVPLLNKLTPALTDTDQKYRALMAAARCGIRQKDGRATLNALMALRHDYPRDPEVLYLTTHVFLQIAVDSSQLLASIAPKSYQVLELEAETMESQNKWDEAANIYRQILEQNPKVPNINLRLGRAILSQPETPETNEAARQAFQRELDVDPTNASAEFWLGEMARREGKSAEAIPHFVSALKLDTTMIEAMLALGMSHNALSQFSEAITPLEQYTRINGEDPAGHYQLAMAYARTGRKEESVREMSLHQQLSEKKNAGTSPQ
jgi:predicted Zn-dependent protease